MAAAFTIRDAVPGDAATIVRLIRALATYEKLEHEAVATVDLIGAALFGPHPKAFALICEADGQAVGFTICLYNFSTFVGRAGIFIEDLFVEPAYRGRGIGKGIFQYLAKRAIAEGCGRIEWNVLNWNEPAIKFYARLGAVPMTEWQTQRITGPALRALAA